MDRCAPYNPLLAKLPLQYKANRSVVYSCKSHVVWTPEYRRGVLVGGMDERLKIILNGLCTEKPCVLPAVEIMPDHVHLLVEGDPQFGIHTFVKVAKGRSSRLLRSGFPRLKSRLPTLWTNSYFVSTVGGAPLSVITDHGINRYGSRWDVMWAGHVPHASSRVELVRTYAGVNKQYVENQKYV
ncbi:putative transposase [Deinococcus hopiensis KR-140]|uniref:Putative transposase n=1 Tax=Deinococcus hopiensis KR-140 TaxID=695939 RepID=A0A1W1VCS5_9DEIO|nr:putative transposase [Deinococcus hopiensis KR-140]